MSRKEVLVYSYRKKYESSNLWSNSYPTVLDFLFNLQWNPEVSDNVTICLTLSHLDLASIGYNKN